MTDDSDRSDSTKALWTEARAAYVRMAAISRKSKKISARMRLVSIDSVTYLPLCRKFTELQTKWNQAYSIFVDAHSKLTAHMRAMKYSASDFSYLCRELVADVEDCPQPDGVSLSLHSVMLPPLQVGPAPWFRIIGNRMHQGPHDETVAILRNSTWQANGEHFTSYDVEGAAAIQLRDQPLHECEVFGPFDLIRMTNAVLWTDAEPLVHFNSDMQHWQHVQTNTYWPEMVIKAP